MTDEDRSGADDRADAGEAGSGGPGAGDREDRGGAGATDSTVDDAGMAAERERARELLAREDLDGLYAAGVSGDEYDYVLAHRGGDPEDVGLQAMGLLAQHVAALVEQTGQPPAQVAGDAAMLARTLGLTGEESLADIEAELDRDRGAGGQPGAGRGAGADDGPPDATDDEGA